MSNLKTNYFQGDIYVDASLEPSVYGTGNLFIAGDLDVIGNISSSSTTLSHSSLTNLTNSDDHTQYMLLAGRTGGQILTGGTGASNTLILRSTSNATKGSILIDETTNSTSTTTGALRVTGGAGISGNLFTGGSGNFGGIVSATSGTASTSATTGALVVTGGAGVSGNVNVGGNLNVTGTFTASIAHNSLTGLLADDHTQYMLLAGRTGGQILTGGTGASNILTLRSTTNATKGSVLIDEITASTSTTTGALRVGGGAGIVGNLFTGGTGNFAGIVSATSGTASTSTTTGALLVTGGAGVTGNLFTGGTGNFSGIVSATSGTASTSTTTGALVVSGGAGVSGNVNVGGNLNVTGTFTASIAHNSLTGLLADDHTQYMLLAGRTGGQILTGGTGASNILILRSTTNATKGSVLIDETTNSTSTTTGALRVAGGAGIVGNLFTGGTGNYAGVLSASSGTASTSTTTGALVVTGGAGISGNVNVGGNLFTGGTGNFTGVVSASSGTASTSTTTGSLVVTGGAGVSGNVNVGGNLNVTGAFSASISHNSLTGLLSDDHTQYMLLAGRTGGQILTGGTGASNILTLRSTTNATKGTVLIDETTASTSTTTGALVVTGGAGVSGNVNVGGNLFTGGTGFFTGFVSASSGTASTSTTTGALVVTGGAGVSGNVNVGGNLFTGGTGNFTGVVSATSGTESTSTTTGALVVTGGAGISGNVNVGGNLNVTGTFTASIAHNSLTGLLSDDHTQYMLLAGRTGGQILTGGTGASNILTLRSTTNATKGTVLIDETTNSTSTTTGALVVTGGAGVSGNVNVGGNLFTGGTGNFTGVVSATSGTESTSTTTGALVVTGGAGISGNVNVGGNLNVTGSFSASIAHNSLSGLLADDHTQYMLLAGRTGGQILTGGTGASNILTLRSTTNATKGTVLIDETTNSTSTTTGALRVAGGAGIVGNLFTGGTGNYAGVLSASSGTASTSTTTGALVVTGGAGISGNVNVGGNLNVTGTFSASIAHSTLTGLLADDHTQYMLLAGRTGGQILTGGTGASNILTLRSTTNATKGSVLIDETTASASTTTGALRVAGGAGIVGNLFTGGTGNFAGIVSATSGTASTSTITGALRVTGGTGITGNLFTGGTGNFAGIVSATSGTASTSTTTGSLVVTGGAGVSGNLNVGGNLNVTGSFSASIAHSTLTGLLADDHIQYMLLGGRTGGQILTGGTGASNILTLRSTTNATKGSVLIDETTTSTSTTTGALVVSGGAGIVGNLFTGGTGNFAGILSATSGTASTSTTTGALVVTGGAGVSGNVNVGGNLNVTGTLTALISHNSLTGLLSDDHTQYMLLAGRTGGQILTGGTGASNILTLRSTTNATKGTVLIDETTNSISTTTGALVVTGGAGISGNVNVGGNLNVTGSFSASIGHNTLTGLLADDHTQYMLLAGRTGGQILTGGTGASNILTLRSTTNATKGTVLIDEITASTSTTTGALVVSGGTGISGNLFTGGTGNFAGIVSATSGTASTSTTTGALVVTGGAGISGNLNVGGNVNVTGTLTASIAHSTLTGLLADDHTQYMLLAGRTGGQILTGGTGASNILTLRSTTNATKGSVLIDEITNSTSTTTGALRVAGGAGIVGNLFTGGTGNFAGIVSATSGTASTSTTTGALVVTGGAGVSGNLNVGGNLNVTGTFSASIAHSTLTGLLADDHTQYMLLAGRTGGQILTGGTGASNILTLRSTTNASKGSVLIDETTTSTSTTTGALVVTGGAGVSGNVNVGGNLNVTGTLTASIAHSGLTGLLADDHTQYMLLSGRTGGQILTGGTGASNILTLRSTTNASKGSVLIDETTTSTSTTTGALRVAGGAGIVGNLFTGGTGNFAGIVSATSGTASTSTTTGALVVTGGAGVSGNLNVGGNLNVTGSFSASIAHNILTGLLADDHTQYMLLAGRTGGQILTGGTGASNILTLRSTTNATKGTVLIDETTASTSTTTGALVVSGGVGVSGNLFTGGTGNFAGIVSATSGTASTSTTTGALVVTGGAGVSGNLNVGGNLNVTGSFSASIAHNTLTGLLADDHTQYMLLAGRTGGQILTGGTGASNILTLRSTTNATKGNVLIDETTTSTSTTTGALRVAGGVGIAGNLFTGGTGNFAGIVSATSGTASTSTTTGALVVSGGVGISGSCFIGSGLTTSTLTLPSSTSSIPPASNIRLYQDSADNLLKSINSSGQVQVYQPTTTLGDIPVNNGTTLERFPVGTNNQMLVVNNTQPLGLEWVNRPVFGTNYFSTRAVAAVTTTNTVFTNRLTLTTGALEEGSYMYVVSAKQSNINTGQEHEARVLLDGTQQDIASFYGQNVNEWVVYFSDIVTLTAGTHTVELQYRRVGSGTITSRNVLIYIYRVS
jgi:hypothetical protein